MNKGKEILKQYWGYDDFRPLQNEIVDSIIYGNDTFGILPTGGGKSICFQVPGIAREGLTLVISPLIALMQDQVKNLKQRGIEASMITSQMSFREIDITLDNAIFGKTKFLYTSPERITTELFRERIKRMEIGLIVVDEAHCISEWGHDFRPSYRRINSLREIHPNVPICAFTASATSKVKSDIIELLELKKPRLFEGLSTRNNINYRIVETEDKLNSIKEECIKRKGNCGIVYCQTRRSVKDVVRHLIVNNIKAGLYHGGLSTEERNKMLQLWMTNEIEVIVATNAFGMGIDKSDVRFVLHYEIPNNLEAYYQESGRAGRDGKPSYVTAYWNNHDIDVLKEQQKTSYPPLEKIKPIYNAVCNFLTVAINSGKNEVYNFDLRKFSTSFSLNASEVFYALKAIQLMGLISFTPDAFRPTQLQFDVGHETLYNFQIQHPELSSLIQLLTRSFPGIFERFTRIEEKEIAKFLKKNEKDLKKQLEFLEERGLILIQYKSDLPQIFFLQNRIPDNANFGDSILYNSKREIEKKRIDSIENFIKTDKCRQVYISDYFGTTNSKCNNCDNCKASKITSKDELREFIFSLFPSSAEEISLKTGKQLVEVKSILQELLMDEAIEVENNIFKLKP